MTCWAVEITLESTTTAEPAANVFTLQLIRIDNGGMSDASDTDSGKCNAKGEHGNHYFFHNRYDRING